MAKTIYALLVGINDYPVEVGNLSGCLNDVDHVHAYLNSSFDNADLAIETLKDSEATRDNVIRQFRRHLGKAQQGDIALFQYCGHGARWASAPEFKEFYPDGFDEGLVCVDSRRPGGFDLADKELAILISEVAKNNPHIAVILDCCHSGSGTRGVDSFRGLVPRVTHQVSTGRPLESYIDGHYSRLRDNRQSLFIPTAKHILLAACERTQLAQESTDNSGVFTSTLVEVLSRSGGDLTYSDLFVRCRAAVRTRATNQNPQFETWGGFNSSSGFLGRNAAHTARRFSAYFDQGAWKVECGAIHGVPVDPEKPVSLAFYPENDQAQLAGPATVLQVGPQKSVVTPGFAADESVRYRAEITSLPVPPMLVFFKADPAERKAVQNALDGGGSARVTLTDNEDGTRYALSVESGVLYLKQRETDLQIQGAAIGEGGAAAASAALLPALEKIIHWESSLALQNPRMQMDASQVDFEFAESLGDAQEHVYPPGGIILDYAQRDGQWRVIRGKLKVRNRTPQTLHCALLYFSTDFGITILKNDSIESGDAIVTVWGDAPDDYFYLPDGANESIENFQLILSTEKVDDFLLSQEPLATGDIIRTARAIGTVRPVNKIHENEWFTKSCRIKVIRRLNRVGAKDARLAAGKIVIKANPSVKANLSLRAARTSGRGADGGSDFYKAFEREGMQMLDFSGTRGADESILEMTDIQNAGSLKENPLQIELKVPLKDDEAVLPLVFDGRHVLLGGNPYKDDDGNTHISIDHIPDVADYRRSLGGSLKLYFFKTYLKRSNVNQLRWVEFEADGSFAYRKDLVAEKVAAACNVLLLVHGIIGDTEGMAAGVHDCGLHQTFDLVLTYDYENLSTPIADTAHELKTQLAAAGLKENDGKRLTLLVHSMGGLVSRWFIEQLGGNKVVDHLVMCGTPNHGSPFGQVDEARKVLSVLTTLSMNYLPPLIPHSSALLLLLNRSKKITPTLEQMNPSSQFIHTLNAGPDPGILYTILAGDVEKYNEPGDPFFAKMVTKAGQSVAFEALFGMQANDIAVRVESIFDIEGQRAISPTRNNVACHHLNYFASKAGQQALREVKWGNSIPAIAL